MGRLQGKRAIITGAASGIGRASAILFAREGADLVLVDRAAEGLEETVHQVKNGPHGKVVALTGDAGNEADVKAYVDAALNQLGGIDVMFANAGISGGLVPLAEQTVDHWQQILQVNLIGPFLAIKYVAPHMVAQGHGAIVCTASVAGLRANAGGSPYSASKAGVISLVQTIANELIGSGVRINAVCPGLIETGMTKRIFDYAKERGTIDNVGQLNPLQRHGEPHEIAHMAAFLASDDASYVNGQAMAVDGGLSSTHPFRRMKVK